MTIFPGANVNPNSPDANLINIFAQAKLDMLQFAEQVNAQFDPDQAVGTILDARCAINGVVRLAGTYTQQSVDVTFTGHATLYGLSSTPTSPFTVSDTQGNQYQLLTDYVYTGAATVASPVTVSLNFQAALIGTIQSAVNTITVINTIIANVSGVNNSSTYTSLGQNEESDSQLRLRRSLSVSLPSKGYLAGLEGGLLTVNGVTSAQVLENTSSTVNTQGVAPHGIWVSVATGVAVTTALQNQIATVIYNKRNAGCAQTNSGTGATATAVASGSTVTITVGSGGTGYIYPPLVTLTGGGGTYTSCTAVVSNGAVTTITVSGASGYTSNPIVKINPYTTCVNINQLDGTTFPIYYDSPVVKNIYFRAQVDALTGIVPTLSNLATSLANLTTYTIGQSAPASSLVKTLLSLAPNCYISNANVSFDNSTWVSILNVSSLQVNYVPIAYQFSLPVGNITLTS